MNAPLLQLIVSWGVVMTLVLIFMLIAFGTALSVFGIVKFAHPAQQKALFNGLIMVLIAGVVGAGVANIKGVLQFDTKDAAAEVVRLGNLEYWKQHKYAGVREKPKPREFPVKYSYAEGEVRGTLTYSASDNIYIDSNQRLNAPAWYFYFRPIANDSESIFVYDDMRNFMLKLPIKDGMAYLSTNGGQGPYGPWREVTAVQ